MSYSPTAAADATPADNGINYLNAEQMTDLMKRDTARWQKSIKDIGLKLD